MRIEYLALAACLLFGASARANDAPAHDTASTGVAARGKDAPASEASIRELLQLSNAQQLIESVKGQVNGMVTATMQQATQGKQVSPEAQAIIEDMRSRMLAVFDETMSWDTLQQLYLRTYKASFSQEEIDGIIKFYKTPAGKAMIKKLPVVMQHVMLEMQGILQPMQAKIQEIQRDTMQKLKSLPAQNGQPAQSGQPAN